MTIDPDLTLTRLGCVHLINEPDTFQVVGMQKLAPFDREKDNDPKLKRPPMPVPEVWGHKGIISYLTAMFE